MIETNDYMTDEEPLLEIARAWAVVFPQLPEVVARIEARLLDSGESFPKVSQIGETAKTSHPHECV